jgi:uncharacterized sulfatase
LNNQYQNPNYVETIKLLKQRLLGLRQELNETDEGYPHIQQVIDRYWDS